VLEFDVTKGCCCDSVVGYGELGSLGGRDIVAPTAVLLVDLSDT
jgi:hypothetical protein